MRWHAALPYIERKTERKTMEFLCIIISGHMMETIRKFLRTLTQPDILVLRFCLLCAANGNACIQELMSDYVPYLSIKIAIDEA